jgi:DNA-binding response OmpR family regulator
MSSDRKKLQVLAIDDEPEILEIIRETLEPEGYDVLTANNPKEGLRVFQENARGIQLVLLDYLMPEMTGDMVYEHLQSIDPGVRVLLLTACGDEVARRMFHAGLRGYMQKPFYIQDLIDRVREEISQP